MPPMDEDGNIIGMDAFPIAIALRGDDAREFILPGGIPESKFDLTAASEDQEEHDCLPPMEHTGSWTLSDAAERSIAEALERIISTVSTANEAFAKLMQLGLSPREERRAIRWDEKNRRRRLKGLPEKPYPFPVTYKCDLFLPPQPGPINVKIEWSEGGTENDQSRDDEGTGQDH